MGSAKSPEQPTTRADFDTYLSERAALIESFMEQSVPEETTPPETISRAVRYSLLAGGKRLRPILVLAGAEAVGGQIEDALPAAAALEMIHTYSLIHDDLPAMDDDSLRRGKPTSHVVFGDAIAILAGDALQAHAFRLLSRPRSGVSSERCLRALHLLADAAGAAGMVGGQVADLEAEGNAIDGAALEFIHRHKTGALLRASVEIGAIIGGGHDAQIESLARYGAHIGLAFQIIDDILDVTGTAESLGKSAGKDERAGKATYPQIHGMDNAKQKARTLVNDALSELTELGSEALPLASIAERILDRSS